MRSLVARILDRAIEEIEYLFVGLWALWYIRSICRACAEEEHDARLLARDGGEA